MVGLEGPAPNQAPKKPVYPYAINESLAISGNVFRLAAAPRYGSSLATTAQMILALLFATATHAGIRNEQVKACVCPICSASELSVLLQNYLFR